VSRRLKPSVITVIAGANGSGKSSIAGAFLRSRGEDYFNPDEAARAILELTPSLPRADANSLAWRMGRDALMAAIEDRTSYAFETTLGGKTITGLLLKAANLGLAVRVWYVGLASVDLHLHRVRERVARGGHPIPADRIRARYDSSRKNLITLLPHLTELRLFDNSLDGDPALGMRPRPREIFHMKQGGLVYACPWREVSLWAQPILAAASRLLG
jgi:predicted ABC-type ATPase